MARRASAIMGQSLTFGIGCHGGAGHGSRAAVETRAPVKNVAVA